MQQMKEIWSVWGCTVWKTEIMVENVALMQEPGSTVAPYCAYQVRTVKYVITHTVGHIGLN